MTKEILVKRLNSLRNSKGDGKEKKDVVIELHHPNQIKNIPKLIPYWDKIRRIRSRKTVALCHDCHNKIHHPG